MSWNNEKSGYDLLNTHLKTQNAARTGGALPIQWENVGTVPASKPYLRVNMIYGENRGKTLSGKEELDAIYQIDLVCKAGEGAALSILGEVKGWFPAGEILTDTGGYVRIKRTSVGPKRVDGDGFFIPLSITTTIQEEG